MSIFSGGRLTLLKITADNVKELAEFMQAAFYNDRIDEETIREKMKIAGQALLNGAEKKDF